MIQNLAFKLVQDLSTLAMGSFADRTNLEEQRWPTRSNIETTQFSVAAEVDASSTSPLGLPVPMVAGLSLATGQATFVEDMPKTSNELFMALVCSTVAHAKLLSVDPTAALAVPGVVRFLDVKDVPEGLVPFKILGGQDEDIFAKDEVLYEGHPIGPVDFWYLLISRRATVPGLYRWGFFTPPVAGADFLAALVASCFLGAFPPVDLRAVCFVRAIFAFFFDVHSMKFQH